MDITELQVPYGAIAVNVTDGVTTRLGSGRLASAIQASTAIPGVFPVVQRNTQLLYDGGLITNVAVLDALEMGARSLVVLDCMFAEPPPRSTPQARRYSHVGRHHTTTPASAPGPADRCRERYRWSTCPGLRR